MTRLSVNVNKVATLRNARGGNLPDVIQVARDCERFGAEGITVHPRPDERHITRKDVYLLKEIVTTEFNIEGYPDDRYLEIVEDVKPTQATLVPDAPDVITSNAGWNIKANKDFLRNVVSKIQQWGCRVSLFVDPDPEMIIQAAEIGADRVELYTEAYARGYAIDRAKFIEPYVQAAKAAKESGLGLNAGHDLNLENLTFFKTNIPFLEEVSIGHALICDSIYYGLENTIQMYRSRLR